MKILVSVICCIMVFVTCMVYHEEIVNFFIDTYTDVTSEASTLKNNKYALKRDYKFIQLTDSFSPESKQDIINIYYTVLNSGMKEFTFYCPTSYKTCIDDVNYISNNKELLSHINNFVPVYNSFQYIDTNFNNLGKVTIHITKSAYSEEHISIIEEKVNEIMKEIDTSKKVEEQIKQVHDYIINNTKYDTKRSDDKLNVYQSDTAYGALIEHYAICGGYTDSMKIFLDRLNIPNYKVSTENHVWNLVYVNDKWLHLDLTWDDPVVLEDTDKNILDYDYFLITTEELEALKTNQHIFNKEVYVEACE